MVIDPVAMAVINDMATHILHRMLTVCREHVDRRGLIPSGSSSAALKFVQVPLEYISQPSPRLVSVFADPLGYDEKAPSGGGKGDLGCPQLGLICVGTARLALNAVFSSELARHACNAVIAAVDKLRTERKKQIERHKISVAKTASLAKAEAALAASASTRESGSDSDFWDEDDEVEDDEDEDDNDDDGDDSIAAKPVTPSALAPKASVAPSVSPSVSLPPPQSTSHTGTGLSAATLQSAAANTAAAINPVPTTLPPPSNVASLAASKSSAVNAAEGVSSASASTAAEKFSANAAPVRCRRDVMGPIIAPVRARM